ncbi:MAG: hypothetical protein GAK28_01482 [Luteibacter sp.]|uniref:hypothetical protein n=1 Tax=Luteibacter sp. TaxID=1886636 RepID=UPI001380DAF4|nr:hypothetical protein [Luteibacter sp.]KAF1008005.1 MAG: hypothetical protein GAK28_01482 [Luteibacter sp.]
MRKSRPAPITLAFVGVFVVTNLFAASSTTNLNSGATVHVARYATWYIGLFVPLLAFALSRFRPASRIVRGIGLVLLILATTATAMHFKPSRHEVYMKPTALSRLIQVRAPYFYDPPPQIFTDRFTGEPLSYHPVTFAVIGPDCAKILVVQWQHMAITPSVNKRCDYDLSALPTRVFNPEKWQGHIPDGRRFVYLHLTTAEREAARLMIRPGVHYKLDAADFNSANFLGAGWFPREENGTWTDGAMAKLAGPVPQCTGHGFRFHLRFIPHVTDRNPQMRVSIRSGARQLGDMTIVKPEASLLETDVPCDAVANGRIDFDIGIEGYMSPKDAGISGDGRAIGIHASEFWIDALP